MMLLALARRLLPADQAIRAGTWSMETYAGAPRLRGRTLGVIGCGRIGSALALRAKVLGMRVVIYDPYKPDGLEKSLGVERCHRLGSLVKRAEIVSVHLPLASEKQPILNWENRD